MVAKIISENTSQEMMEKFSKYNQIMQYVTKQEKLQCSTQDTQNKVSKLEQLKRKYALDFENEFKKEFES